MKKRSTSLRLSDEARSLLTRLSEKLGISQTAVLELAIRKFAQEEGINEANRRG